MATLLAFLKSLPELMDVIKKFFGWMEEKKVDELLSELKKADTPESKQDAAKDISDLITHL